MNVDRNARIMSVLVMVFAGVLGLYLAWNPRGISRSLTTTPRGLETPQADSTSLNPVDVIGRAEERGDLRVEADSNRWQRHFARLTASGLDVKRNEILKADVDTVYDAVAKLRPYWLDEELHAVVRVGGQLVGDIAALNEIEPSSVEEMRLEFSPTEPHWIIQIFLAP